MTQPHLEELRRKLAGDSDFGSVWDYFLTNFAGNPQFIQRGKPGPEEPLLHCISECYRRSKPNVEVILLHHFLPIEVPEFKLVHGAFQIQGEWCGFVYFTDLDMGMVCFSNAQTGRSIMGRFHTDPKLMKDKSTSSTGVH